MKFILNYDEWQIKEIDSDELLDLYNKEYDSDSTFCFGVTLYPKHEIWINDSMCQEQKIKTLKHELTHAYIWEHGLYNVPSFTEEMVCDLVASAMSSINEIISNWLLCKYKKVNLKKYSNRRKSYGIYKRSKRKYDFYKSHFRKIC